MDPSLQKALSSLDVSEHISRATLHAEFRIREFLWSGFKPTSASGTADLTVAGLSAGDFVCLALQRLINGVRQYDNTRSLLENLKSVADSIIWSAKKANVLDPTVDYRLEFDENGNALDPISTSEEESPSAAEAIVNEEIARDQQQHYANIYNSFDGNKDVQDYLEALSAEIYKAQEIADYSGLDVNRVYEIRKMLKKYAPEFFGVLNSRELERKIAEGI